MGHFGLNRAPERSAAAAQGFNAFPGAAPRPLGQGFGPLGPASHVAFSPGDLTSANGLYDSSHGAGQQPAALPASPLGYGSAYSPSDPCESYTHSPSFLCTDACFVACIQIHFGIVYLSSAKLCLLLLGMLKSARHSLCIDILLGVL